MERNEYVLQYSKYNFLNIIEPTVVMNGKIIWKVNYKKYTENLIQSRFAKVHFLSNDQKYRISVSWQCVLLRKD